MIRLLSLAMYYVVARWLPISYWPGGRLAKQVRGWLARRFLAECGRDVNVDRLAYFGSGRRIYLGDRSGLGINCWLAGEVHIGRDVMMAPNVTILTENHEFADISVPMMDQGKSAVKAVIICNDVWLGQNVMILPGVTIGRGAVIGAGAVVTRDVPDYGIAAGNPARVIRDRRTNLPARDQQGEAWQ